MACARDSCRGARIPISPGHAHNGCPRLFRASASLGQERKRGRKCENYQVEKKRRAGADRGRGQRTCSTAGRSNGGRRRRRDQSVEHRGARGGGDADRSGHRTKTREKTGGDLNASNEDRAAAETKAASASS